MPASNPDRDLHLARRQRLGFRRAEPLANEIEDLLGSEDFQRMRRFQKVNGALRQVLSVAQIQRLKPVSLKAGLLTIEVTDGPLLAELRQHHERAVLNALAHAGTGVSKVVWRLGRSVRK